MRDPQHWKNALVRKQKRHCAEKIPPRTPFSVGKAWDIGEFFSKLSQRIR